MQFNRDQSQKQLIIQLIKIVKRMVDIEKHSNNQLKMQNLINKVNGTLTLVEILSDPQKIDKDLFY